MAVTWRPDRTTLAECQSYVAGLDETEREKVRRVVAAEVERCRYVHSAMVALSDLEPDRPSVGPRSAFRPGVCGDGTSQVGVRRLAGVTTFSHLSTTVRVRML